MKGTVFCLHGFLGLPSDWDYFELPSLEFKKIDLYSVKEPAGDFESWAQAFNELALKIPGPRVLLGYSLGGRLGLNALVRDPLIWDAAIFVSTHPGLPESEREPRIRADELWAKRFESEEWISLVRAWNSNPAFGGKPSPFIRGEELFQRANLAHALRAWSTGGQRELLPQLMTQELPILWITGQEDRKYSEFSRTLRSQLVESKRQNWTFWEAPEVGHRVPWEDPGGFQEHFSGFLNKVLLGKGL